MPVFTTPGVRPRVELAAAVIEGEGQVDNLIGSKLLPGLGINKRNAHIVKATLADTLSNRILGDKFIRSPGSKFERATMKFGDDSFSTVIRGEEIVVPNEATLDYAGFLVPEQIASARFGQHAMLTQEYLIANAAFNTTTFGAATNSSFPYTGVNRATMDPIGDIIASTRRVKGKGEAPDTVVMSGTLWERVRTCNSTLQYLFGQLSGYQQVSPDSFATFLAAYGIKELLIGDSYLNISADGQPPNLVPVWSNNYIGVYKAGKPQSTAQTSGVGVPTIGGVGAWIWWEEYTPDSGYKVESYESIEINSVVVRVEMSGMPYFGNTRAGDLIATGYN